MNIPDKVRIAGVDYAIEYKERLIDTESHVALVGQIDYDNAKILIEPTVQDKQSQCRTLLHEILHGLERHFKLDFEEDEIDNLANGLYMVIKDNPGIFEV